MRTDTVVRFRATEDQRADLRGRGILPREGHDVESNVEAGGDDVVVCRFAAHSSRLEDLLAALDTAEIAFEARTVRRFTPKEIQTAQALHIRPRQVSAADETDDTRTCSCRTSHADDETEEALVDPQTVRGTAFARGPSGEILVRESIAVGMIEQRMSGAILRRVRIVEGEAWRGETYFELLPTQTLPNAVSPPTRLSIRDDSCPQCRRRALALDSMLYYDVPLDAVQDVNITFEVFGHAGMSSPDIVVSPRFHALLVSAGVEVDELEPVLFV